MKPMEVLDLCPQSTVTTLFLDELLVSMKIAGFQTGVSMSSTSYDIYIYVLNIETRVTAFVSRKLCYLVVC